MVLSVDTYLARDTLVALSARKGSNVPDSPNNSGWWRACAADDAGAKPCV